MGRSVLEPRGDDCSDVGSIKRLNKYSFIFLSVERFRHYLVERVLYNGRAVIDVSADKRVFFRFHRRRPIFFFVFFLVTRSAAHKCVVRGFSAPKKNHNVSLGHAAARKSVSGLQY